MHQTRPKPKIEEHVKKRLDSMAMNAELLAADAKAIVVGGIEHLRQERDALTRSGQAVDPDIDELLGQEANLREIHRLLEQAATKLRPYKIAIIRL